MRRVASRLDAIAGRHAALAIPIAVGKKFGEDRGGRWAALLAYYGFFSLFPLLLALATITSFVVQGNPDLQDRILDSALSQFPIIGDEIRRNLGRLQGSVVALAIGLVASLWAGTAVVLTLQEALDDLWDVPRRARPGFVATRVRALVALGAFGAALVAATGLSAFGTIRGPLAWHRALALAGTFCLNALVLAAVHRSLTVAKVRWRQTLPGAFAGALAWMVLLAAGSWLVDRQLRHASALYGFFAIVLGLLSWIYLAAQTLLLSAELNVVLARGLWPRSLTRPDAS